VLPLTFFVKINMEKPLYSIKQQLAPFRATYKLLNEFSKYFQDPAADGKVVEEEAEKDEDDEDSPSPKQKVSPKAAVKIPTNPPEEAKHDYT
jgi:hypothetical protein